MLRLWVDKYAPHRIEDYVWRDDNMRSKFQEWIADGAFPHLLLCGKPGSGKTSLARMILNLVGVPSADVLFIKASSERRIDDFEAKIKGFVQTYPMMDNLTNIKYIILDESDTLSELSQKTLRSDMEMYSDTVRWILTCNYPQNIIPAIRSRCQEFDFQTLSMEEFVQRGLDILRIENVNIDTDEANEALLGYVEKSYPDMRQFIGFLQANTIRGELVKSVMTQADGSSYADIVNLFEKKRINEARKLLSLINTEEYPNFFRFLYENLHIFSDDPDKQDDALIIIRDGLYRDAIVGDREINLSATLAELARI